jgi:preprotein translocase subunit SecD
MDNDSFNTAPPPLPAGWPVGARDAQFRGAACDEGYSPDAARKKGETGDDAVPLLSDQPASLPSPYIAVRRLPFLTRRDVLKALFSTADDGTYRVDLKLTPDGAKKIQEYTAQHAEQCIALVAGGKIVWHPTLGEPVTDDTFVLSGQFTVTEAQAITNLFNE